MDKINCSVIILLDDSKNEFNVNAFDNGLKYYMHQEENLSSITKLGEEDVMSENDKTIKIEVYLIFTM